MIERIQRIINRRQCYRRVFCDGEGKLTRDAEAVLADLARFCRAHGSTTIVSPISRQTDVPASFQAEGRREAYYRIIGHLFVDDAELVRITQEHQDE